MTWQMAVQSAIARQRDRSNGGSDQHVNSLPFHNVKKLNGLKIVAEFAVKHDLVFAEQGYVIPTIEDELYEKGYICEFDDYMDYLTSRQRRVTKEPVLRHPNSHTIDQYVIAFADLGKIMWCRNYPTAARKNSLIEAGYSQAAILELMESK